MQYMHAELVSAFSKVIPGADEGDLELLADSELVGVSGSKVAFQLIYRFERQQRTPHWPWLELEVSSDSSHISASAVELVPVNCPGWRQNKNDYLATVPTLLPDRLLELCSGSGTVTSSIDISHVGWNSVWIELELPATDVRVILRDTESQEVLLDRQVPVNTICYSLPDTGVTHLRWMHADCIAAVYDIDMWSVEHWKAIENYMAEAVRTGVTGVMAPVWTPPLDLLPGEYRPFCQLLGIKKVGENYEFDFSSLEKWIEISKRAGLTDIEVPHFFSQWGARSAAPFFVSTRACARYQKGRVPDFGWHTNANDCEYLDFLSELIPALRKFLESKYPVERIWWHISDEPRIEDHDEYSARVTFLGKLLQGAQIIDAVSDPEFRNGVGTPVVATSEVTRFRTSGYEPEWVYYCVSQSLDQANQFIAQPANRHLCQGFQLYKMQVKGFLHWGFSFYYSQYSRRLIDPRYDTDAGGSFISGDAFLVYPGRNYEPVPSLRSRMIAMAWEDLRLCRGAERIIGRERVLEIIDPSGDLDYDSGYLTPSQYQKIRAELLSTLCAQA